MLKQLDSGLELVTWVVAAALVMMLFVGPRIVAEDKPAERIAAANTYGAQGPPAGGPSSNARALQPAEGKPVFVENCGSCHTLADAGTSGKVGPALDGRALNVREVLEIVAGGRGTMPAFGDKLSKLDVARVAVYVADVTKK